MGKKIVVASSGHGDIKIKVQGLINNKAILKWVEQYNKCFKH